MYSAIDIETIRVSAERDTCGFLERTEYQARLTHIPQNAPTRRRELLGAALLLTATMAPDAHAAAREAMDVLGVSGDIELYQSEGRADTARLALHGSPIGVEFVGGYLASLDHGGLLAQGEPQLYESPKFHIAQTSPGLHR